MRNFGETVVAEDDGIKTDFKLTTEGNLTDADLPLATGEQSPAVVRRAGEIGFGVRNAAQSYRFGEQVAKITDPKAYARYLKQKKRAQKKLGINLDRAIIGQFTGDATMSIGLDEKVAFRSAVRDPKALQATLKKVAPRLEKLNPKKPIGVSTPKGGKGFYAVAEPNGDQVVFGVVGGNFVLANDANRAAQIAGQSPTAVPGAKGAGVVVLDTRSVATEALRKAGQGAAGALFTGALGDFVGSVQSETDGLTGSLKLNIK
jgi:hypothetical protein